MMMDGPRTGAGWSLPALSESLVLRFVVFTALYAAQGIPAGLLMVAVPAYMAQQGFSPGVIGSYIGIVFLPWSLKLINGPIMDRWGFLPMGRRRPWVLVGQVGMVVSSAAMGLFPALWPLRFPIQIYVTIYVLLDTLITISFFAVMMAICWKRVAATQFSLYMAIANTGSSGGAALLGPLQGWFGYSYLFVVAATLAVPVIGLLWFIDVARHRERVTVLDGMEAPMVPQSVLS